ncbi:hypothetical protein ACI2I3_00740 [Psychrobacter namhaensis]|uniref:Uncharacterized protein n=1 Tax=Psychrobacter namhaensis TaxID=292734 RepID=A0ABW8L4N1_9GAMM
MKLALRIRIDTIRVGEQLFNAMLDDEDNVEPMTNALTGEVCDVSAIYKGYLVLRDDRCGDEIDDIQVELSGLIKEADDG